MNTAADLTVIAPPGGLGLRWWTGFVRRTREGRDPLLIKGAWAGAWPGPEEVDDVVRRMQGSAADGRRLRIYLDRARRNDLAQAMLKTELPRDRTVFEGMRQTISAEHLAFIINDVQDWSPRFTAAVGELLSGMFEIRGLPPGGIEQIVFAGNYAGTPFGAHRGYEHAWLCHLGPASKEFYLWSAADFERLTGSLDDVHDYRWLLPHGIRLVLEPGDVLYLPAQWFHIGMQDAYSCSLALGMYDQPLQASLRGHLDAALAATQPWEKTEYFRPTYDHNPLRPTLERHLAAACERMYEMFDDRWLRLCSNAGSLRRHEHPWPSEVPQESDRLALWGPFRVAWCRRGARLQVYLCHLRVDVVWHPAWPLVFTALDRGAALSVAEIAALLADRWSPGEVLAVLRALAATGGLRRFT